MGVVRFSVDVDFEGGVGGVGGAGFSVDMSRDGARTESTGKERPETKRPGRERVTSNDIERSMVHPRYATRKREVVQRGARNGLQWYRGGASLLCRRGTIKWRLLHIHICINA